MRIALQLYTLREPAATRLAWTLNRVRDLGFDTVQWSGMPDLSGEEIRGFLDNARLQAVAGHCAVESFERDYDDALRHWRHIGVEHLAPGGMMTDCRDSHASWLLGAARLDALGGRLLADGVTLSYHNHDFELGRFDIDADSKLELLYRYASPAHLKAELDVAWLAIAGVDPAHWLDKYAGRCPIIHVKDTLLRERQETGPVFTALGDGNLDWDNIMEAACNAGVEWLVYEQDNTRGDIWDDARRSRKFLEQYLL